MVELNDLTEDFIDEFGSPTQSIIADNNQIEKYRGKLPNSLLDYWKQYGFSGFKNGLFWIVNPSEYDGIMNTWLSNLPNIEDDTYSVIARSGFGDLYLWGKRTGFKYEINACNGWIIEKDGNKTGIDNGKEDYEMQMFFALRSIKRIDMKDETGSFLFNRAVQKYGHLSPNEMFGFEPALFIGGRCQLSSLRKVDLHIHMQLLTDFGHRELLDRDALIKKAFGR